MNDPRQTSLTQVVTGWYEGLFVRRARLAVGCIFVIVGMFAVFAPQFHLDASGDSLMLENDEDLRYYRSIRARYGSGDYLVITYTPEQDLFSAASLEQVQALRDELAALDGLAAVTTILDVPLIDSPRISLEELRIEVPTLLSERTDRELARRELTESSLYRQLLTSVDGRTTALLATFRHDPGYVELLRQRDVLREKQLTTTLTSADKRQVATLSAQISTQRALLTYRQQADIGQVREILDRYRAGAEIRLGGIPMIVTDMLDYIKRDVIVFGTGILVFLIILLTAIFIRPRWVILSMLSCLASVVIMTGGLGLTDFPVTVVSSNFVALLLIFSLSITVHLIVRYRELHAQHPDRDQAWLVTTTVRDKFLPCLFTTLTTIVAFASLLVSGIRPVMDFGWMMVTGLVVVMIMAFTVFTAGLMLLDAGPPQHRRSLTAAITGMLAGWIERRQKTVAAVFIVVGAISGYGMSQITVENRFIDNFKESTEIYRGMVKIDQELGGTTPLDVIIDADPAHFIDDVELIGAADDDEFDDEFEDEFDDEWGDAADSGDLGATSYWYNTFQLRNVARVHDYLESLPETGKVLSMATTIDTLQTINDDEQVSTFWLSILYKKLPESVKSTLFDPFMSADGNQVRFSIRVFESNKNLRRGALLDRIRTHLTGELGYAPERVHLTGMLVLYNNVLQSLYESQILTLGFVFGVILVMFLLLYRSLLVALIALVPNFLAAGAVLGLMGLLGIPLDIMTITIAAIVIGIGVDDTIHYLHRFRIEYEVDRNYHSAVQRSHGSIGRAMYYTSIIISVGFSILVLSNFLPTIYFGILTGFAMLFAMIANLTILPLLLIWFKPLGKE
jgi:predicted RND superfamily exporter protein